MSEAPKTPRSPEDQKVLDEYLEEVRNVRRKGRNYVITAFVLFTITTLIWITSGWIFYWIWALSVGMGAWGLLLVVIPRQIHDHFTPNR